MKNKGMGRIMSGVVLATALAGGFSVGAQQVEKPVAFPGAEGFGRYTSGGRGGKVYHVTNLRDNGSGSLRWALGQAGPRTIVFDVSGTIHLESGLKIPENTTIAGQTAPGDGICLADYPVSVASNCIVRYMRFRLGNKNVVQDGADGWDGLSVMDSHDIIIDHCSVSWSIDECCSVLGNRNTTLQWCIVSQSLVNSGHSKGAHGYGGNWGGTEASFHHNLVVHHGSRTPRLGPRPTTQLDERMDMRNNVIYNFGGNGCYGGEGMTVNIVNNYYKPGPGSPTDSKKRRRIAGIGVRTKSYCETYPDYAPALHLWGRYYVTGNVNSEYGDVTRDNWTYGMYNQIDTSASATDGTWNDDVKAEIKLDEPMAFMATTTHTAEDAYERVLDYAGASLSRDSHDEQMASDTRNGVASFTGSGNGKGFINSQDDNKPAGAPADWSAWPTLTATQAPIDSDGDGMPDEWEVANGLDPANPEDRNVKNSEGFTNIELYLAELVEHITEAQNEGGTVEGYMSEPDPVLDSYEISALTKEPTGYSFGYGISLSNVVGGGYNTRDEYIGVGRDQQHMISLPQNAEIKWIRVEGFSRYAGDSYDVASLVELNGETYPAGTYSLPKGMSSDAFEVVLKEPATQVLTMTWTGNNPWLKITLYTTENAGVGSVSVDEFRAADNSWYNLQGMKIAEPSHPGLYIHGGKVVVVK